MVEEQAREGGGSDMKLKDITVKRITPEELPSILCFQLNYKHHTELGKLIVMFDGKQQILYFAQMREYIFSEIYRYRFLSESIY